MAETETEKSASRYRDVGSSSRDETETLVRLETEPTTLSSIIIIFRGFV